MKHILFVSALCALFFVNGSVQAASDFTIHGKTIKAECLKEFVLHNAEQKAIDDDCLVGKTALHHAKIQDDRENSETNESYKYEYLGRWGNGYLVRDLFDGGGSMKESSIRTFHIEEKLGKPAIFKKGETLVSGDRCMDGITTARMQKGKLYYSTKITEYGLINIVDWKQAKNYEELDKPNNCVGIASYSVDPKDGLKHLRSIAFDDDFVGAADGAAEFWPCLQYIASQYIRKHGRIVSGDIVMDWVNDIKKSCSAAYESDTQN